MYKVSVIVPIYKVERFIRRCAETLFQQTLKEVQYIFIDDSTPDSSIDVLKSTLERFPERLTHVRIMHHETNKGLPAARNTGLAVAEGEYVFHCDSDDYVELNLLETMYRTAKENDADIVYSDFYLAFQNTERYMVQPTYRTPEDATVAMLSGTLKFNVWNKLVKRSLYYQNSINFPDGFAMGEDMTMILLAACAEKIVHLPSALYHYIKTNTNAYTQNYKSQHYIDLKYNIDRVSKYLQLKFNEKFSDEILFLKLDAKYSLLISDDTNNYNVWRELFPEADTFIGKNRAVSFRRRLLQFLARYKCDQLLRIHYYIVYKIIYRLKYM